MAGSPIDTASRHELELGRLDRLRAANIIRVLKLIFVFLLLAHWVACIWWALGTAPFNADDARRLPWLRRVPHRGTPLSEDSPLAQS